MANKRIHSITIGDPKTGLKYSVGQKLTNTGVTITSIQQDDDYYVQYGKLTFCVFVVYTEPKGDNTEFVWMRLSHDNLIIQYDFSN